MAAGIPALAFQRRRSGMGWVGQLPGWPGPKPLMPCQPYCNGSRDPSLLRRLGRQARQRYGELFARRVWLHNLRALR